jgi:hypothetical protein
LLKASKSTKIDLEKIRNAIRTHAEKLRGISNRREPEPGKTSRHSIEEEFID